MAGLGQKNRFKAPKHIVVEFCQSLVVWLAWGGVQSDTALFGYEYGHRNRMTGEGDNTEDDFGLLLGASQFL